MVPVSDGTVEPDSTGESGAEAAEDAPGVPVGPPVTDGVPAGAEPLETGATAAEEPTGLGGWTVGGL